MSRAESKIASSLFPKDDWRSVSDPNEQRKIQNRLAQQNFRESLRVHEQSAGLLMSEQAFRLVCKG